MTIPFRWEAVGVTGELFPALDADLTVAAVDECRSRLSIVGAYRPPFGRAGVMLDKAIMHRIATATIRSFVQSVAAVVGVAREDAPPSTDPRLLRWRPTAE
jgi:hypothetical protein